MINIRNFCFILGVISSQSSIANDLEVKLKGAIDFQSGFYKTNSKNDKLTNNKSDVAFNTSAGFGINVENTLDSGFVYGADVGLKTTAKSSKGFRSKIYTITPAGKLEFGSDKTAAGSMRITPGSIAAGPGGAWDSWVNVDANKNSSSSFIEFITSYSDFLDSKFRASGESEYARKITYYTPEFKGIQVGISYIPDGSNQGSKGLKDDSVKFTPIISNKYFNIKDGIATAVSFEHEFDKDVSLKVVGTYEWARVKATPKSEIIESLVGLDDKVKNIDNYQVGLKVNYNNLSFAGSYGDYQTSLLNRKDNAKTTKVYGVGLAYKFSNFKTSATYFKSSHLNNNVEAETIAVDYTEIPGFKPYAEFTHFNGKGRHIEKPTEPVYKHSGQMLILGTKLSF